MDDRAIKDAYDAVFDGDGEIRACGREKCKALIRLMSGRFPGVWFGDPETGVMRVPDMKLYRGLLDS